MGETLQALRTRGRPRLDELYIELLRDNPEWETQSRRHHSKRFFAAPVFWFFVKDTDVSFGSRLFTNTVTPMSARDSSNTHEVIGTVFRSMNIPIVERAAAKLARFAELIYDPGTARLVAV